MAKKMKRLLALIMALALCAGQIAVPAMAAEEAEQVVNVTVTLDEYSQIPDASEDLTITVEPSVENTVHDPAAGEITESTSTTTTWTGTDENGAAVSGSETTTEFTTTDDFTGDILAEGGTLEGEQTKIRNETEASSETETLVTEEITTTTEEEIILEESVKTHTEQTGVTEEGQWISGSEVTEGTFAEESVEEHDAQSETELLAQEEIPDEGITIVLTPNAATENAGDFTGEYIGDIILLEDAMEIPEGAELFYDHDGYVIGYRITDETSQITGTTEEHGDEVLTGQQTDATGTTTAVTPDLDAAAENLSIPIDDSSVITEEYDPQDADKITAYVVTNTKQETGTLDAYDQLDKPASGTTTLDDGSTQTIITEDITDENGNVVGFISRTVITDANGKVVQDSTLTQTVVKNDPPAAAAPVTTFTLPAKPAESTVTDAEGNVTTTTVAEILDDKGTVIGYETVTVKTNAEGTELFRGSEEIYGTTVTETENVTVDGAAASGSFSYVRTIVDTYRVTAEETVYEDIATYNRLTNIVNEMTVDKTWELVEVDGKLYYIYTGSMLVTEGKGHGDTTNMVPITPMDSLMKADSSKDLEKGGGNVVSNTDAPKEGFKYVGYGVDTSININKGNSGSEVVQFRLKSSDGKEFYAMCIDFNTTIKTGHLYDIADITSENYYQQSGSLDIASAEKIRSVALNGYWGTASDVGSMADVQAFLIDYLVNTKKMTEENAKKTASSLTPGQAVAATQAALWKFGNKDKWNTVNDNNLVPNNSGVDETNVKYLYDALLAAANDPNAELEADEGVEFLDAADVTGGAITIKNKVEDASGAAVYNTDLSFTLGIEPSKLNGDLIVTVTVGNEEVKKVRLAGADNPLLPLGRIVKNDDGSYTIPDVEIAEGVNVNLNLTGTQALGTGVYIYTSLEGTFNDSQTLVTLASGSRDVNLNMTMNFTVEEPTATRTEGGETWYGTRTDERTDSRTDITVRTETTTVSQHKRTGHEAGEGTKTYLAEVTVTKVKNEASEEKKEWNASWEQKYDPQTTQQDDDFGFEGEEDIIIPEEEVPLAKAPETGDISLLWAAISLCSIGGIAVLNKKREEI